MGSDMIEQGTKKPHVLVVTIAFAGHFAPFVQILYHLAARHKGLTVTVWGNKNRIADLTKLQRKGDLQTLDLRYVEAFGEIPVYAADPKFPVRGPVTSEKCKEECESFRRQLVERKGAPGAPTVVFSDMFQYWAKDLADELGIPWYTYYSVSSPLALCAIEGPRLLKEGLHPYTSPNRGDFINIPGLDYARIADIAEEVLGFPDFYQKLSDRTKRATAILLNSSEELELPVGATKAMRGIVAPETRVLPIGPSLQYPGFGYLYSSTTSNSNCLEWLNSQATASVLYIAFGSVGTISKSMTMELATGLEASGVPFLWALKPGSSKLPDLLPAGFEERTKGRGLIETGWAPQARILAHHAIGGFLSHGGWNSTMESLCAGVPLIVWPLSADQPMNARYVADVAKVGFTISMLKKTEPEFFDDITREEVANTVKLLMLEEEGREVRRNVVEVKKSLIAAVSEGGSSHRNLTTFLNEITSV